MSGRSAGMSGRPPRKKAGGLRDEKSAPEVCIEQASDNVFLPVRHMRVCGGMFGEIVTVTTRIGFTRI